MKSPLYHLVLPLAVLAISHAQEVVPVDAPVCDYPVKPVRPVSASTSKNKVELNSDQEPNNAIDQALALPLGFAAGQDQDVDVSGGIQVFDVDWFSFHAEQGDTLGIAIIGIDGNRLDSEVSIHGADGNRRLYNSGHGNLADLYPPESPFPAGGYPDDSALTYSIPATGTYYVRIAGEGAATGAYFAQMRLRKPPSLSRAQGAHQVLFLDFDGAQNLKGRQIFGKQVRETCNLSRFSSFLSRWGIPADQEKQIISEITRQVTQHFDKLLAGTECKLEILNSQDHADSFGAPDVSRVIVGGTINEFGHRTIGLAEFIDPGNFSTNDTAVVLLDLLSDPTKGPDSILRLERAPGYSVKDAVVRVLANLIVHETCHFLGCWHTSNGSDLEEGSDIISLMDKGGDLANAAGIGKDGILGTADDAPVGILDDHYAREGISGDPEKDKQNVQGMVKASLAVGRQTIAEERAALEEAIANLTEAKEKQAAIKITLQPTPQDTRKILGLPKLDTPVPDIEADRLSNAIKQQQFRLERLASPQ